MKVYQCIHKYPPHIPLFEKRYDVTDEMDFSTLQKLLIEDGYASSYILLPALEHQIDQVFYTVWDYKRLQFLWARENGLKTKDLDAIKLAQMEAFQPDVFYNMSAMYDSHFIKKSKPLLDCKNVYWNGIIEKEPQTFLEYDGQLSLHRPYIKFWKKKGLKACELQPAIPKSWSKYYSKDKSVDVLFYGQYQEYFFGNRNKIIERLLDYKLASNRNIHCHLQYNAHGLTIFRIPKLPWTRVELPICKFPGAFITKNSLPPIYGEQLYEKIGSSKIVVNAYTNYNIDFKSNMRLFEAIGLGAFLISETGNYPDGLEPGVDFYTYSDADELIVKIGMVLNDWDAHAVIAKRTSEKLTKMYTKDRQWDDFKCFISSL